MISNTLRCLLVVGVMASLAFTPRAHGQAKTGPLVIEVTMEGKAKLGADAQFFVELRNTGTTPLALPARPSWDAEGGLELRVMTAAGAARALPQAVDASRNPSLPASRRAMTILPGNSLGIFRTVNARELFVAPGDYTVVVSYRGTNGTATVSAPLKIVVTR